MKHFISFYEHMFPMMCECVRRLRPSCGQYLEPHIRQTSHLYHSTSMNLNDLRNRLSMTFIIHRLKLSTQHRSFVTRTRLPNSLNARCGRIGFIENNVRSKRCNSPRHCQYQDKAIIGLYAVICCKWS